MGRGNCILSVASSIGPKYQSIARPVGRRKVIARELCMKYLETSVQDCFIIEPDRFDDERGYFSKIWDKNEFAQRGLSTDFA